MKWLRNLFVEADTDTTEKKLLITSVEKEGGRGNVGIGGGKKRLLLD